MRAIKEEIEGLALEETSNKFAGAASLSTNGRGDWLILDVMETKHKMIIYPHGPLTLDWQKLNTIEEKAKCETYGKQFARFLANRSPAS